MTDKWFQVVQKYPKKFGLTIPFILGALRQPVGQSLPFEESLEELRALLVAFRDDAPYPYKVIIQDCGDLGEPIVTFSNLEPGGRFSRFSSPSKEGRALYFNSFYISEDDDFESLVKSIWGRYKSIIFDGHYSGRGDDKWEAFDEKERANLKNYCEIE